MSKSPSLRRIQADVRELALDPSDRYHASPLESDMFEWHFTIRGADETDFEGGVYHGRIILPAEYPFKPPHIMFLTPSGRFETNTKVCLSFSAYHPELWQPAWGIRLILEALISFLPTPADGAIGALDWTSAERKKLAKKSVNYFCPSCNCKVIDLIPKSVCKKATSDDKQSSSQLRYQKEIEQLQLLQSAAHTGQESIDSIEKRNKDDEQNNTEKVGSSSSNTNDEKQSALPNATLKDEEHPKKDVHNSNQSEISSSLSSKNDLKKIKQQGTELKLSPETSTSQQEGRQIEVGSEGINSGNVHNNAESNNIVEQPTQYNQQQQSNNNEGGIVSWLIDPLLQCIIVLLAIICYLFIRKFKALMEELQAVDS